MTRKMPASVKAYFAARKKRAKKNPTAKEEAARAAHFAAGGSKAAWAKKKKRQDRRDVSAVLWQMGMGTVWPHGLPPRDAKGRFVKRGRR